MSQMVQRVAKALWEQRRKYFAEKGIPLEEWGNGRLPSFNGVFEEARAAIESMRPEFEKISAAYGGGDGSVWIDDRTPIGLYVDGILNEIAS